MKIRYAKHADIDLITSNNRLMALETEGKKLRKDILYTGVKSVLDDPALGFYLLLEVAGKAVGQLMITTEWSDWRNGSFWWIQSVYVLPEYRNQGFYSAMHAETRRLASKAGNVVGLRLYVDRKNEKAQVVYRKMGMKESNYLLFEEDWS